jgi:hypothetical protein
VPACHQDHIKDLLLNKAKYCIVPSVKNHRKMACLPNVSQNPLLPEGFIPYAPPTLKPTSSMDKYEELSEDYAKHGVFSEVYQAIRSIATELSNITDVT